MEKYRQFADGGTGVNPFVPHWSNHRSSLPVRLVKALIMTPIALVRLGLFLVAVFWLALTQLLCALIPIPLLRRPIQRLLVWVGCSVALLALGVFGTGDALADHRRLKLPAPKTSSGRVFDISRGGVVIVNQQGLTDVLYLGLKLCPAFVFPAADGAPVCYSLLGALMRAGARRPAAAAPGSPSLQELAKQAQSNWQPLVVFAEGARTNGSCVLSWRPATFAGVESFDQPVGSALMGIVYSKSGPYTPHHTVGTTFRHLFWMCQQPFHTLSTVWLPMSEVASAVKGKSPAEQISFLRTLLVRMIPGAVEVDIAAPKHLDFMAFWDKSQKRGYTAQKERVKAH